MVDGLIPLAEEAINTLYTNFKDILPSLIFFVVIIAVIFIVYQILTGIIKGALKRTVKRKEEIKNILGIWRYTYLFLALVMLILTFSGSLAATGISIGLMSAALGWALQKPITGIAGWLMVLIKKPFKVGNRVIIGDTKGDVAEITMFYVVLKEVGGTIVGEESSGRTILIPTSTLFDQKIINYSLESEFILDEIGSEYTYKSNLAKIEKIIVEEAEKATKEYLNEVPTKPFSRVYFNPNGMRVRVRYYVATKDRQKVMTDITRGIYKGIMKEPDTEFAYPHTELVFRKDVPLKVIQDTEQEKKSQKTKLK